MGFLTSPRSINPMSHSQIFPQVCSTGAAEQLKCLQIGEFSKNELWPSIHSDSEITGEKEFTKLLENLFHGRHDYEVLEIRCLLSLFDMSTIVRQGHSLRSLILSDVGCIETKTMFSTTNLVDLNSIQRSCVHLKRLDIGIGLASEESVFG
jgi:hypothetical protein